MPPVRLHVTHKPTIEEWDIWEDLTNFLHRNRIEFIYFSSFVNEGGASDHQRRLIPSSECFPRPPQHFLQDNETLMGGDAAWRELLNTIPLNGVLRCQRFLPCRCANHCSQFDPNMIYCVIYEEVIPDVPAGEHE